MKKLLLFSFVAAICCTQPSLWAQGSDDPSREVIQYVHPDQMRDYSGLIPGQKMYNSTVIGTTWYDAQAINYGNVMPRSWEYDDGTIGASWISTGEDLITNRGIGYNYFDGTEWGTADPHVGPEDRHGTVCYAPWGANGEIACTYQYIANEGPILFFRRDVKGEGDWIQTQANGPAGTSIVWQSMATSGENHEYIHLLAYTYDVEFQGQENALLYYRSDDGGESWDPDGIIIDGLGIDYLETINALSYNFSNSVGNTIAFTYGFDQFGGWVFKSTDNGDNWDMITVLESPYDPFNYPTEVPAFGAGIGSSAIALDSDGKAHVVFPRMLRAYTDPDWSYYPWTTDGLIYWNEDMAPLDSTIISTTGLENLDAGGYLCGYVFGYDPEYGVEVPTGQPNYANAMCGFPVISIDDQDNIFIASSNMTPDYMNGEFLYRHIVANSSFDGGVTWNGMIPMVDNTIHFLFQEDVYPGTFEWPSEQPEPSDNKMYFMSIPKSVFVGIEENERDIDFELSSIYPNPANASAKMVVRLENSSIVQVDLLNAAGQSVKSINMGYLNAGNHTIKMEISDLPAGIYYFKVNVDGQSLNKKLIVL